MNLSKREFLKTGMGGAAACILGPFFNPSALVAGTVAVPTSYLDSAVHSYWMRLSYNERRESRSTRRNIGAALRNIGNIRGNQVGFNFTFHWDQAVRAAFVRWAETRQKPGSLPGLIRMIYEDFLYPKLGPWAGRPLFGTLFSLTRGQDGSAFGETAHAAYRNYRTYARRYKDIARISKNTDAIEEARTLRAAALKVWQTHLLMQIDAYAKREARLNPEFALDNAMIDGFEVYINPDHKGRGRLRAEKHRGQVVVSWTGDGQLEEAPSPDGPWTTTRKASPAPYDPRRDKKFFRTVDKQSDPGI